MVREETRVCSQCNEEKPVEEFAAYNKYGQQKRRAMCLECYKEYHYNYQKEYIRKDRLVSRYNGHYVVCMKSTGTYSKDARLLRREFDELIADGYMDPGSVWYDISRKTAYVVKGNELYHNLVGSLREPDWDYLDSICEKQRVSRVNDY